MKQTSKLLLFIMILINGCVETQITENPYVQFYTDNLADLTQERLTKFRSRVIQTTTTETRIGSNNEDADIEKMREDGYYCFGFSSFSGSDIDLEQASSFGRHLKAAVVVVYPPKYLRTDSGITSYERPSFQNGTTSYFGSNGFYGNTNTNNYGTKTVYESYNVDRFGYVATYWVKMKPPILGVRVDELSADQRREIASNKGLIVNHVVRGSPGFEADIFKGDILMKINNVLLSSEDSFYDLLEKNQGKTIKLELIRNKKVVKKVIVLNKYP